VTARVCVVGRPFVLRTILNVAFAVVPATFARAPFASGISITVVLPAPTLTWALPAMPLPAFWALGHLELSAGNLAAARNALVPLPSLLRETGLGEWSAHPVHPDAIETLVGLGEIEEAVELTAELEEYARRLDRPWGLATVARSTALIAAAGGANDEALEAAERALTPTEERVAELAGQGLRNAEIAALLYVTPKTVEATLSRVYRKLAIRSRTELARRLSEPSAGRAAPPRPPSPAEHSDPSA
jgi:DNA-binding CsgD family transcriptional regulator